MEPSEPRISTEGAKWFTNPKPDSPTHDTKGFREVSPRSSGADCERCGGSGEIVRASQSERRKGRGDVDVCPDCAPRSSGGAPTDSFEWAPFHGCFTGDCPHEDQGECLDAIRKLVEEMAAQVSALRQEAAQAVANARVRRKYIDAAAAARQEAETLRSQLDALLKFAGNALTESRADPDSIGDWDAASIQDALEASGLIEPFDARKPCGERCACAEVSDFPTTCLRLTALGRAASAAARVAAPREPK
jgi:hypothetical protein